MKDLKSNHTLQRLLDANRRFDLNGRGTTNHCPMALTALASMGAAPDRLERFFTHWERRHALAGVEQAPLSRDRWLGAIGCAELFGATRNCFADWVAQDGADAVLQSVIGEVSPAPASGAFHALIRLAYGLLADNAGEIGAGLAALVCGRLVIDIPMAGRTPAASVQDGLASLSRWLPDTKVEGNWIAPRLRAVAQLPSFRAVFQAMPQNEDLLAALRRAALALYWQTDDFVALHLVTGVHAARVVLSQLPHETAESYMPELWAAFCAAYVVIGAPPMKMASMATVEEDWPALFAMACKSDDDHDIKLVHTCFEENRVSPLDQYHAVAQRRLARAR